MLQPIMAFFYLTLGLLTSAPDSHRTSALCLRNQWDTMNDSTLSPAFLNVLAPDRQASPRLWLTFTCVSSKVRIIDYPRGSFTGVSFFSIENLAQLGKTRATPKDNERPCLSITINIDLFP